MRIDPALWAELEAWAQDELRSVNGQIEYVLRQAVVKRRGGKSEVRSQKSGIGSAKLDAESTGDGTKQETGELPSDSMDVQGEDQPSSS